MKALQRLRKAAEAAIDAPKTEMVPDYRVGYSEEFPDLNVVNEMDLRGWKEVKTLRWQRLESAWRDFPECERDEAVPSPADVLAICARMEREQAEQDAFDASVRAMR
jgi:hypothetical protein